MLFDGEFYVPQLPGVTNRFVYDSHVGDSRGNCRSTYPPTGPGGTTTSSRRPHSVNYNPEGEDDKGRTAS